MQFEWRIIEVLTDLSTEAAGIFTVLGDFHLFHHFTKGSTVTGTIFTGDSNLLRTFGLKCKYRL